MALMIAAKTFHDCKEELRDLDLKATPKRLAVLKLLETTDKPVDIAMITVYLKKHKVKTDPATVFRIMNLFTAKGITKQIQLNESKFRYELSSQSDHHHLICESCGSIEDITDCNIEGLEKEIEKKKKFKIKSHALEFFGLCSNCQS